MGFKLSIQTFSFNLLVLAFLGGESFHVTEGFKHSLKLYFSTTAQDDFLTIETKHPNLDFYGDLLSKVKFVCSLGVWDFFTEVNYQGKRTGIGSTTSSQPSCRLFNVTLAKSIRYFGASETTKDSISLYEKFPYLGNEILVEGAAFTGIFTPVKSISGTGNFQWKLFDEQHLEGKSVCIQVPKYGSNYYYEPLLPASWNFTTIGSVFKGCNLLVIEEYKRQNNI